MPDEADAKAVSNQVVGEMKKPLPPMIKVTVTSPEGVVTIVWAVTGYSTSQWKYYLPEYETVKDATPVPTYAHYAKSLEEMAQDSAREAWSRGEDCCPRVITLVGPRGDFVRFAMEEEV